MSSGPLFATSVALVMIAAGLALWALASQRTSNSTFDRFITRRASLDNKTPVAVQRRIAESSPNKLVAFIDAYLTGAGVTPGPSAYIFLSAPTAFVPLVAGYAGGGLAALIVFGLCVAATYFYLWIGQQRHQKKMVAQLPALMDAMVRMITIGNSIQSAFQSAIPSVPQPLRSVLEHASRLIRAGLDLDQALFQVARIHRVDEIVLFAAIVKMSAKYGGRADQVLERMGNFMRDREEAERELSALSSETRMSAWVLGLLPITIGLLIAVLNANYVAGMWFDHTGRVLMLGALALQVVGAISLYRLARLR